MGVLARVDDTGEATALVGIHSDGMNPSHLFANAGYARLAACSVSADFALEVKYDGQRGIAVIDGAAA